MARIGLQFRDIEKAALELQGNGKVPTVDGVRELLGSGSKSTIAQHLKAWRSKQTEIAGELPYELAALVTGLWKKLHDDATRRVDDITATYQQQILELNKTMTELYQTQTLLKKQLHQSEEATIQEQSAKENLEKQRQEIHQEHLKQTERYLAISQQLEASQAENTRLHRLAMNIQTNFEHYQEKMHQHQLDQALLNEKQQTHYLREIAHLKQQLTEEKTQVIPLTREREQLQNALEQLEARYQPVFVEHHTIQQQFQGLLLEKNVWAERDSHAQKTIESTQNQLAETTEQLLVLERKTAVLLDQNNRMNQELAQAQDKIETLRHEKLFLIQEKSQLEGYVNRVKPT